MVKRAEQYPWSSAAAHCGFPRNPSDGRRHAHAKAQSRRDRGQESVLGRSLLLILAPLRLCVSPVAVAVLPFTPRSALRAPGCSFFFRSVHSAFRTPRSALPLVRSLRIPHSALRTPNSALAVPIFLAPHPAPTYRRLCRAALRRGTRPRPCKRENGYDVPRLPLAPRKGGRPRKAPPHRQSRKPG
jgi:hypothetical protein